MNDAMVAYEGALQKGDATQLNDSYIIAIPSVVTDSDILIATAPKVNGATFANLTTDRD